MQKLAFGSIYRHPIYVLKERVREDEVLMPFEVPVLLWLAMRRNCA